MHAFAAENPLMTYFSLCISSQIFLKRRKGKLLLDNPDKKGNTALHVAALQGNNRVVKVRDKHFLNFICSSPMSNVAC